jgi:glycosyltransferase involved in cell wall biosynthesis
MRILMISTVPPYPLYYGDRLMVFHLGHALAERGHTVDLLALTQRPEDHAEQRHYAAAFGHIELIDGARHTPAAFVTRLLRPGRHWPSRAEDSWAPGMWRAIERRLDAEHYDVAQLLGGTHVYEFFGALRGVPAVITPADSFGLRARRMFQADGLGVRARLIGRLRWLTARGYERWMYDPFARTVVLSDVDRAELLDGNPALAVDVIPNGVDLREFAAQPTERTRDSLLFVGNFEYGPNADAALALASDLFPRVLERVPGAQLWLVGNGPSEELRSYASESITITGRVPDVQPYLARASAFVSPLRVGVGVKNKVLEALAMGCPLVASPLSVDGIAVTEGHDAIVAEGDALAAATVRVLQDPALRRRLSENGRALIEGRYSWAHVAAAYESLYAEIQPAAARSLAA